MNSYARRNLPHSSVTDKPYDPPYPSCGPALSHFMLARGVYVRHPIILCVTVTSGSHAPVPGSPRLTCQRFKPRAPRGSRTGSRPWRRTLPDGGVPKRPGERKKNWRMGKERKRVKQRREEASAVGHCQRRPCRLVPICEDVRPKRDGKEELGK